MQCPSFILYDFDSAHSDNPGICQSHRLANILGNTVNATKLHLIISGSNYLFFEPVEVNTFRWSFRTCTTF